MSCDRASGVLVGYYRTRYGNLSPSILGNTGTVSSPSLNSGGVLDNLAVTAADYDPFCITAPVDPRLPGGGGNQICGLYDLKPAAFGKVDNLVVPVSQYGKASEVFNGIDVSLTARMRQSGLLSGGVSWGRVVVNNCFVVDTPQQRFCKVTNPAQNVGQTMGGVQVKAQAVYPLPWDFRLSAVFQSLPGIPITAAYVATNAQIVPTLGRNLSQCGSRGRV